MAVWRAGDWVGTAWIWLSWLFSIFWTSWLDCAVFRASLAAWTLLSKSRNAAVFSSANIWLSWICWRLVASAASIAARAAGFLTAVTGVSLMAWTCAVWVEVTSWVDAWAVTACLAAVSFWRTAATWSVRSSLVKFWSVLICCTLLLAAVSIAARAAGLATGVWVKALMVLVPLFWAVAKAWLVLAWSMAVLAEFWASVTFWRSTARSSVVKSTLFSISVFLRCAASATACLASSRFKPTRTCTWTVLSDNLPWLSLARKVTVYSPSELVSILLKVWPSLVRDTISAATGVPTVCLASSSGSDTLTILKISASLTDWPTETSLVALPGATSIDGAEFDASAYVMRFSSTAPDAA